MRNIILEMQVKLTEGEQARVWDNEFHSMNLEVFEKGLLARWYSLKMTPEGNAMARQLAEEANRIEPSSWAYGLIAFTHMHDIIMGLSRSPSKSMALAEESVKKALQLDDSSSLARESLAGIYLYRGQYDDH